MPKITVLIPVHNRAHYIGAAIDSVLAQTAPDFELLVVDDGSTDASVARIQAYNDPRIRLLRNATNLGIAASRNRGIAQAKGEYLAFLDSDDYALAERLALQSAFLDTHPDHAAVGAFIEWIDSAGQRTGRIKRKAVSADAIAAQQLFRAGLENTTAMARTAVLREFVHREDFALGSDYDLWVRIAAHHRLAALPRVLVYRREHGGRASHDHVDHSKSWRLEIFAAQLRALGIAFTKKDLERHYLLRRMHKLGFVPDRAYLDWAENWLTRLQTANREHGLYAEPMFSAVLGTFWAKTCARAIRDNGPKTVWRFVRSPLCRGVWPGLRAAVQTRLRRDR